MSTPVRRQYLQIKRQYPDAILFFRLGDFYETFDEDAKLAARELDIVLTSRNIGTNQRIPLAGIPYHAAEGYIAKLINKGYKVAICEQVGEAVKGLMPREVVRVVTPGTVVEESLLEQRRNNYLVALVLDPQGGRAGLAYADITTGDFAATQWAGDDAQAQLAQELQRLQPRECLWPAEGPPSPSQGETLASHREASHGAGEWGAILPDHTHLTPYDPWRFELETARQALLKHFDVATLDGYGCAGWPAAIRAAGALVQYLQETQPAALTQLTRLQSYSTAAFMTLDPATRRNLELNESTRDRALKGSLLWVLDATETAMGGRLLRRWLNQPLLDLDALVARQDAVAALHDHVTVRAQVRAALHKVADLERLTGRVAQGIAGPRALIALRESLEQVPALRDLLEQLSKSPSSQFNAENAESAEITRDISASSANSAVKPAVGGRLSAVISALDPAPDTVSLIAQAIADDAPATPGEGTIRPGFSAELDGVRALARGDRDWVARLERTERERTGIKSLKVGYNKVFGYYLEVTKPNVDLVPADYIRKQTLVNAERYITPELKEVEARILNAEERMGDLETAIYRQVLEQVAAVADRLTATAHALAELDVYAALAEVAERNRYVRPALTAGDEIRITAGRHPVVELTTGEPFVPNDAHLSNAEGQIVLLTGPNMAGKCVTGNTLIFTDRGLTTIKDLMPNNAREGEFTEINNRVRGLTGKSHATHFYKGGQRTTIKLVTRRGYHLEGTPEHKVWVRYPDGSEGWKQLANIAEGDIVAIERQIDLWGRATGIDCPAPELSKRAKRYRLPDELSEDLAYMMGLLVGDGTLTYRNSVVLSTGDSFIAGEYHRIVDRLFGYQVGCKANGKDFFVTSKQIRVFLANLGLGYGRAHEKHVPLSVLRAPKHIVTAFLQGLFDADGYAENRYGNARLATASIRLAREVQMLLLNLGIIAPLRVKETTAKPSYRVSINGADAITFHQQVGFRLPRKRARSELASDLRMPNIGGIPHLANLLKQVQARIVAATDKPVALKRNKSINSIFYTYIPSGRNISYDKLDELIAYCYQSGVECPELEDLQAKRYFYDEVETVDPGEAEVYDLSVAKDHAYVANGFVSHNSTYLRQTALICLMAQIGSFVPADAATIGLMDRIFTRVGAQDDIATGQSTFMVEMVETALILQNATPRSLIILDEIGRGTSTYDGVAIARAVVEYLHNNPRVAAKTIFATHYHELTELEGLLPRVRNFNVAVLEEGSDVVFLRQVVPGAADRSYGIHVARMAGVPRAVTHRAEDVLAELESLGDEKRRREAMSRDLRAQQLSFMPTEAHPVVDMIRELKVEELTPLEAINKLYDLQRQVRDD